MELQDLISFGKPRSIVAVRDDASFRTNLILCGTAEFVSVDVDVTLISPHGSTLGARLDLSTPTRDGSFAAYAAVIDNVTNDPRTLLPQ